MKTKTDKFVFGVTVAVPKGITRKNAKGLLEKFISIGEQEAMDSVEVAEENGDTEEVDLANATTVTVSNLDPNLKAPKGYVVVQEADNKVIGNVIYRPSFDEAIKLAVELAVEQGRHDADECKEELEDEGYVADPDGGWAVYVTGIAVK